MEFTARPHAKFCLARTGNRKSIWSGLIVESAKTLAPQPLIASYASGFIRSSMQTLLFTLLLILTNLTANWPHFIATISIQADLYNIPVGCKLSNWFGRH